MGPRNVIEETLVDGGLVGQIELHELNLFGQAGHQNSHYLDLQPRCFDKIKSDF